ncbi:MAG: NAD(P)H-hydrate dehydratase [Pirellulales bacterium]|nr:NAD(P)H-hydrate dehydratase [Pirellulales bacterium]
MTDTALPPLDCSELPRLPPRAADSHKGTYGRALLIGGSQGMTGAIGLAGMAALRGGAGLVQLAVPAPTLDVVASYHPCYLTVPLEADLGGRIAAAAQDPLLALAEQATAVGCGPGQGTSTALDELVGWLYVRMKAPAVFDADSLNALARRRDRTPRGGGPRILTPHPGEFARLTGMTAAQIQQQREASAVAFARQHRVTLVLKGHRSIITDGDRLAINTTGNPGMATGGTGDVLTGLIVALLCQGLSTYDAARLGAYVHGLAGDIAAARVGQIALVASDLLAHLPAAIQQAQGEIKAAAK